jgi:hypothetical protein
MISLAMRLGAKRKHGEIGYKKRVHEEPFSDLLIHLEPILSMETVTKHLWRFFCSLRC